ncbi:MAG: polysaccharide lyase family 8 super-sandwich domain-containing protein [Candidatus Latescibacterota bacterium]
MGDLEIIARRLRQEVLPGIDEPAEALVRAEHLPVVARAEELAGQLQREGRWPDIDYEDPAIDTPWPCLRHVERMACLAAGCRAPGLAPERAAALRQAVGRGLGFWLARNPVHWGVSRLVDAPPAVTACATPRLAAAVCSPATHSDRQRRGVFSPAPRHGPAQVTGTGRVHWNWWYNQIGVPLHMGPVLLLLGNELPADQRRGGLAVLERARWQGATGANLTWLVGIQLDWSFHQHGEVLMSGSYGASFAVDAARTAARVAGTRFAFSPEQICILSGYVLDGQQWMVRGRVFDYGCVGREICRRGKDARPLVAACRALVQAGVPRQAECEAFARRLQAPHPADEALVGNRHYWKSDFMVHHRRAFYASARMHPNRVDNTDSCCTHENRRSHLIADGASFLLCTGEEYADIFPVWDWKCLPGVTADLAGEPYIWQTVRQRGVRDFVGGVSDGLYGCAFMDLARWNHFASKGWFFFDREYVCLGSRIQGGIFAPSDSQLVTSVNQCHWVGEVTACDAAGTRVLGRGARFLEEPVWVHHDGVGYCFPQGGRVVVANQAQTGRWTDVGQEPEGEVTHDVFSLWLDHGTAKAPQSYAYVVVPGIAVEELDAYAASSPVQVLQNQGSMAVWHRELRLVQAAFTGPGVLEAGDGLTLSVDRRCLLVYWDRQGTARLAVANPLNLAATVTVTISRRLAGEGCAWDAVAGVTRVTLELPQGEHAGQSAVRELGAPA